MARKLSIIGGIAAALALSTMASATAPSSANSIEGTILGTIEGALKFCSKVSPGSLTSYAQVDQLFTAGQTSQSLSQVRNGDAYETAFSKTTKLLQGLPASQSKAECNAH